MNIDSDTRFKYITIKPASIYGTTFIKDDFHIPADTIEVYNIYFKESPIGQFWVSNSMEDSVQLFTPVDVGIMEYILELVKTRSFRAEKNR